jgi:hypothetical protein
LISSNIIGKTKVPCLALEAEHSIAKQRQRIAITRVNQLQQIADEVASGCFDIFDHAAGLLKTIQCLRSV